MIELNNQIPKKVISLICATDAFLLRNRIAWNLWYELEKRVKDGKVRIEDIDPRTDQYKYNEFIEADTSVIRSYWCSLNDFLKRMDFKENFKNKLEPDNENDFLYYEVSQAIENQLYSKGAREIAHIVLRYSKLFKMLDDFNVLYKQYLEKKDNRSFEKLMDAWSDFFVVLVSPVNSSEGKFRLFTMNLDPSYQIVKKLYAHMDTKAYKCFYQYVRTKVTDIDCRDYRQYINAGIRSLNCAYFNNLNSLISCGDHPAALLCGCRSGVQYQVRAKINGVDQIIGMVTVYFPIYNFWSLFGVQEDGSLMEKNNFAETDESFIKLLSEKEDTVANKDLLRLIKILVEPFIGSNDKHGRSIINNLTILSSISWANIEKKINESYSDEVNKLISRVVSGDLSDKNLEMLVRWYHDVCSKVNDGFHGKLKSVDSEDINSNYDTKMALAQKNWPIIVNDEFKKPILKDFYNDIYERAKLIELISSALLIECMFFAEKLKFKYNNWKGPQCYCNRNKDNNKRILIFELIFWYGSIEFDENNKVIFMQIGFDDNEDQKIDISGLLLKASDDAVLDEQRKNILKLLESKIETG